jgi:phospholipid/cholesterol/gamma-HCH transport system substrate-binding protein
MKKTTKEKLKLGVFVTLGSLIFMVAIYMIGQRQNLFAKSFKLNSNFTNVNGLIPGNNVRYSGINVGTVKRISMVNDSVITVEMLIEEQMIHHIKTDAIATIGSDGLVGNRIINILPGNRPGSPPVTDGDLIKSYTKIGTDDMLNTLSSTNENAALLISKLLNIANEITEGEGTLGMLINDTLMAQNLKETTRYLKRTSMEAHTAMKDLNSMINSIDLDTSVAGVLLNDSIQGKKIKRIISNLETASLEINQTLETLNSTIRQLKEGEGALNYLSNDEELVQQLQQILLNVEEGTAKFNENMEALKHNPLTRGYFKKLEKEARKAEKQ